MYFYKKIMEASDYIWERKLKSVKTTILVHLVLILREIIYSRIHIRKKIF